jgi:hypothetical protein
VALVWQRMGGTRVGWGLGTRRGWCKPSALCLNNQTRLGAGRRLTLCGYWWVVGPSHRQHFSFVCFARAVAGRASSSNTGLGSRTPDQRRGLEQVQYTGQILLSLVHCQPTVLRGCAAGPQHHQPAFGWPHAFAAWTVQVCRRGTGTTTPGAWGVLTPADWLIMMHTWVCAAAVCVRGLCPTGVHRQWQPLHTCITRASAACYACRGWLGPMCLPVSMLGVLGHPRGRSCCLTGACGPVRSPLVEIRHCTAAACRLPSCRAGRQGAAVCLQAQGACLTGPMHRRGLPLFECVVCHAGQGVAVQPACAARSATAVHLLPSFPAACC